jgi:sec-independent protein translocase protein TatA
MTCLFGLLNGWEIVLLLAVVFLLFGVKKLPALAKGLGQSIREFRGAVQEEEPKTTVAERKSI